MTKSKSVGGSKRASTGMIKGTIVVLHTRKNSGRTSRRIKQSISTDTGIFTSYSISGGISKSITAYNIRSDSLSTVDSK